MKKQSVKKEQGIAFTTDGFYRKKFEKGLSFKLTNAQSKVIEK